MNIRFSFVVFALAATLLAQMVGAEGASSQRHLSNVKIFYIETWPNSAETNTSLAMTREILKKFERKTDEVVVTDPATGEILTNEKAEDLAMSNGYLDMPIPMYGALIRIFSARNVASSHVFHSKVRSKEQVEELQRELNKQFPATAKETDYTLVLVPYRASYHRTDDAIVRIGALLYDEKASKWVWTYYVTVPFGMSRNGFSDADGERLASLVIGELARKGWIGVTK